MAFLCSLQNAGMPATVRNNEFFPSPKLTARKRIRKRELNRCKKEEKREGEREREREIKLHATNGRYWDG